MIRPVPLPLLALSVVPLTAGTLRLVQLAGGPAVMPEGLGAAAFGNDVVTADLAKGAGWVLNLAVAEWAIRRPATRPARRPARAPA